MTEATTRRWFEQDYLPQAPGELFPGPWLVFAPHPDDETYGMGGAIAAARARGIEVTVVVVTDGALGGEGGEALVLQREAETRAAAAALGGVALQFWRYPDRGLSADEASIARVRALLETLPAGTAFFPSPGEPHPDHRAVAVMVWEAVRRTGFRWLPVSYDISVQGQSNHLLDVSATMPAKRAAMAVYASQEAQRPYAERIEALSRTRAWSLGETVEFAEAFQVWPALDQPLSEVWLAGWRAQAEQGLAGVAQPGVIPLTPPPAELAARITALEHELAALRASHSWRVTAPLRGVSRVLQCWRRPLVAGRRLRLLIVMVSDVVGGAEILTVMAVRGLVAEFDVTIVSHAPVLRLFAELPVECVDFATHGLSRPFDLTWPNARAYARAIAGLAAQQDADVIYAVMHHASAFVALAHLLHPVQLAGRRCVGSLHGSLATYYQLRGTAPSLYERLALRAVPWLLDAIITPSQGVADELVRVFKVAPRKVVAIHNGFDFERIRSLGDVPLPIDKRRPWIVSCSRLSEQKDYDTLLRAVKLLLPRAFELILVGEGEMRASIEQKVRDYGLQNHVKLVGFDDNPFRWMRHADVFVLASFYEGFGNVLVEAMLQDVPVVANDCPWGPAEIIQHDENGLLAPVGDAGALAQALASVLDEPQIRVRLVANARQALERFSLERMTHQYADVFHGRAE